MVAAVPIVSPRHIVQRKALKDVAFSVAAAEGVAVADPPLPRPGDMQLYSFYTPSLEAGTYTISTKQHVWVKDPTSLAVKDRPPPDAELVSSRDQQFEVVAPQFAIDPKDIHSCYPPQGHADQAFVVPHIVFNDPHLPWERRAISETAAEKLPDFKQNRVPWLALFSFDCNGPEKELRMANDLLVKLLPADLVAKIPAGGSIQKANSLAVTMTVEQYLSLGQSSRILLPKFVDVHDRDKKKPVDVIFLTSKQFKAFFTDASDSTKVNLNKYRLLSHVRNINTIGMPQSGIEDQGLFSIIVSHRSGPTDIKPGSPSRTQMVHLLTLEFINDMDKIPTATQFVAVISLASWSYQCQPPLGVNFVDAMYNIGMQLKNHESCLLRPSDAVLAGLVKDLKLEPEDDKSQDNKAAKARNLRRKMASTVHQRMNLGYTLVRHRLANGEETVAFHRGPLLPVRVARPTDAYSDHPMGKSWPKSSNFGQDFQIMDGDLGIMDISYSAAWQLGKTLAVADSSFAGALMRVRSFVHSKAISEVKTSDPLHPLIKSRVQVLSSLPDAIEALQKLANGDTLTADLNPQRRWQLPQKPAGNGQSLMSSLPASEPQRAMFSSSIKTTMTDQGSSAGDTVKPFAEITAPASSDWALIHKWIMDKLYLSGIPHNYFITDPSHVPPETIRFFHIDDTWFDCFIDGALSVANHLSRSDDDVRRGIKEQLNDYFQTEILENTLDHYPQVPVYGFLLKSKVVECFPDLRVEVPFADESTASKRASILVLRLIGKDMLLCLLDRQPDSGELKWIKFTQPEHQQCFSIGEYLDDKYVQFKFRKIPPAPSGNVPAPIDPRKPAEPKSSPTFGGASGVVSSPQAAARNTFTGFDPSLGFDQFDAWNYPIDKKGSQDPINGTYSWSTRCLNLEHGNDSYSAHLMAQLGKADPNWKDGWTTSALIGLEMNLPVYYLLLKPPVSTNTQSDTTPDPKGTQRIIWVGPKGAVDNTSPSAPSLVAGTASIVKNTGQVPVTTNPILPRRPGSGLTNPESPISTRDPVEFNSDRSWFNGSPWGTLKMVFKLPPAPNNRDISSLQYSYRIYPHTFRPDKAFFDAPGLTIGFVPLTSPYDYDLIVSVRRQIVDPNNLTKELATASLFELSVRLPLPDAKTMPDKSGNTEPLITVAGLRNSRPLSNQRWVVRVDLEPAWVVCRLIPRSSQWSSPLRDNKEISFRLNGVGSILGGKAGLSAIMVTETYRRMLSKDNTSVTWEKQGNPNSGRFRVERKAWTPTSGW